MSGFKYQTYPIERLIKIRPLKFRLKHNSILFSFKFLGKYYNFYIDDKGSFF